MQIQYTLPQEEEKTFRHCASGARTGRLSSCLQMAVYRALLLLFTLSSPFTMRSFAYLLPGLLNTQLTKAGPAWISPEYGVSNSLLDPDHNKLGAVASESSICSNVGTDVLTAGGNAADSMVATVFCVGVIGMYHRFVSPSSIYKRIRLTWLVVLAVVASCS